jgi:hypothetical protein
MGHSKLLLVLSMFTWAACTSSGDGNDCPCALCSGSAVTLAGVDNTGAPVVDGWDADAVVDGVPVDTACSPLERQANISANICSFGTTVGVYQIVVHRESGPDIELITRNAAPSGVDCCNTTLCSLARSVVVTLP